MGLALSFEQVEALDERVEGWIAGLQMAALSMRGREDVDDFIRALGTHRFIMDFMLEEVLAGEPEGQAFLLQTAILTRLSGPLCDAVTGSSGGQEMLERLETATSSCPGRRSALISISSSLCRPAAGTSLSVWA